TVGVEYDERPREIRPLRLLGEQRAHQRHVLVNRRILDDAEPLPDFRAHLFADRPLFFLGDVQVVELALRVLNLLRLVEDAAQRRLRRRGRRQQRHQDHRVLHTRVSLFMPETVPVAGPTTSKIATGCVLPFTTTSPSGRNWYSPFNRWRVASLMIIRVPNSLFSDSSREPRLTASPITV